jgi:hypothetical protein
MGGWGLLVAAVVLQSTGYSAQRAGVPAATQSPRPVAVLNAVSGSADALDLLASSEITLAAGADIFAYHDTGRLALGSLTQGRVFASLEHVATYSLFAERGQLLVRVLAADSKLTLLDLSDRTVVHEFDDAPITLLTPQASHGLTVGYRGSDFNDDRRNDSIVLYDLTRLTRRDAVPACSERKQDHTWGKAAAMSLDGRIYAVTGPCGARERVAVYAVASSRPVWWLDAWEANSGPGSLMFSDDGTLLLHVHPYGQAFQVIDTRSGRVLSQWKAEHRPLRHVALDGRDVVLVQSEDDVEQPWRLRLGSTRPVRDDTLLADWRFLVADGLRYVGPWVRVAGGNHVLRLMVDGTLELVSSNNITPSWTIPVSRPVSVLSESRFVVADGTTNDFQEFVLTGAGVRTTSRAFNTSCGARCQAVRVSLDEDLRANYAEAESLVSLVDMRSGQTLDTCRAATSEVSDISRRHFATMVDEQARIVRWADCRTVVETPASDVEFVDQNRVIVIGAGALRVLDLDDSGVTERLRVPWSAEDASYDYSPPGLLVVDVAEVGVTARLPRHHFSAYDLSTRAPVELLDEMVDCQPFGQAVAADGQRGLVAIECNQAPAVLVEHAEVRLFKREGARLVRSGTIPMPVRGELVFALDGQLLVDAEGGPLLTAWRVPNTAEDPGSDALFRLALSSDGIWTAVAGDGRFDTNELETNRLLSWVLPGAATRPIAVEAFVREYYEPQLMKKLLAGEELPPVRPLSNVNRALPDVSIQTIRERLAEPLLAEIVVALRQGTNEADASEPAGVPAEVKLFMNGTLVEARLLGHDFSLTDGAAELVFTTALPRRRLDDGVTFTAYAYNQDQVKSEASVKRYTPTVSDPGHKGRAVVVAIGVDAVQAEGWDLSFAVNDASMLTSVLGDALRSTGQYATVETVLLTASRQADGTITSTATKSQIAQTLSGLGSDHSRNTTTPRAGDARPLEPDDLLVLAISSHGVAAADDEFYLLPSDVATEPTDSAFDPTRAISRADLAEWLTPIRAGNIALIIDACQSARVIGREGFKPGPMGSRDFGQLAYDKGMLFLASSQSSEEAVEVGALRHGLLSYALVTQGLAENRADRPSADGIIDLREWLAFAAEQVPALQSRLGQAQTQQPALFDFVRRSIRRTPAVKVR